MSSLTCVEDDNVAAASSASLAPTEDANSEITSTVQANTEKTESAPSQSESKTEKMAKKNKGDTVSEGSQTDVHSDESEKDSSDSANDENENVPAITIAVPIEEVDSRRPNNQSDRSGNSKSPAKRILLKRRSSRISTPTVGGSRTVQDEVDSSAPRPSKRRSQRKPIIALFLESDYPRKK